MNSADVGNIQSGAAIVIDRRGYIVGWNEGAQAVLGFAEKDVVGRACHHILCGKDTQGRLVCHPWCPLSSKEGTTDPEDGLVLYPRSAAREVIEVTLSAFRVATTDASRGWVVHLITSANPAATIPPEPSRGENPWGPRQASRKQRRSGGGGH